VLERITSEIDALNKSITMLGKNQDK